MKTYRYPCTGDISLKGFGENLIDVEPGGFNMDLNLLHGNKTTASVIAITHFLGFPCDMKAVGDYAKSNDCFILQDTRPEYMSEITLDEDNNLTDMGRAGESTSDGNYYYHGSVRLYSDDGGSETFDCYEGKVGMEKDAAASCTEEHSITLTEMIM